MNNVKPRQLKLKQLKDIIDKAVEYAGDFDPDVEIWIGDKKGYYIGSIGQFGFIPDLTIHVGEKFYDSRK